MTFVYEGHPSADQMVTGFLQSGFVSTGAKTFVIVPFKAQVVEVGFVPITDSCTSATTLQVILGSNANSLASGFVTGSTIVITSTTGTFSSVSIVQGGCNSSPVVGSVVANRGDGLQFTMSGGNAGTKNALVYAILRRADPQGTQNRP